jgi:TetR/AcrR family transcriptional repressor of nem operon
MNAKQAVRHGRKRANDPETMRSRVLDAAADEFQLRGYNATSMHDILGAAGVTGGALHHHFRTKQELGLAVIRERVAQAVREAWLAPIASAPTALQGISSAFGEIAASVESRGRVLGCPVNNLALELSLADPAFRAALSEVFEDWRHAIAEKLRADQAKRLIGRADADELATFVVCAYSGAMALAKARQEPGPLRACSRQLERLLAAPPSPIERRKPGKRRRTA